MSVKVERKSQYHPGEKDVKTGVLFELPTGVHEVVNVDAFGDCGNLSLLEDPIFETWTVKKLRSVLTSLETLLFVDTANNLLGTHSGTLALESWRTDQRKEREWMDYVVMLAVLLVFNG
ncbi:hypothetical protein SARC_08702 [Sphaeroforma arctica JP610]|uniref:Uncharacterized protein n=1 Tax=Sphaeroforma arctica JP610 TaxID=667725 RepID=A0A0L0FQR3_9EUKA|nr:hypothetical protein SARC_08702 [Sphaeroforma arctica JP610]KNC78886.1 hypothetical protein SARC_08702 [Sphaeroforma arctica JP610]|eukprot:XP_014152788.1 hypothetical protein SARC_08702 [Sphaeroforma arctica JP610]